MEKDEKSYGACPVCGVRTDVEQEMCVICCGRGVIPNVLISLYHLNKATSLAEFEEDTKYAGVLFSDEHGWHVK